MVGVSYQFTVNDLARMPDDGTRYEVIDGELYGTSTPSLTHQLILAQLAAALAGWRERTERGLVVSGVQVIMAFNVAVVPDLLWVSDERLPWALINRMTEKQDGKLHLPPDLAVEILSPGSESMELDCQIKLSLYSRRGVREYWLVDRFAQRVEVYRREQAALVLAATLTVSDTLTSPLLPGFALPVEQIFRLPKAVRP